MGKIEDLRDFIENFSTVPTIESMPRRTLESKGISGPTGAHVIEEIHTPFNLDYVTITTGTTAFQNIVGVTKYEIPSRKKAAKKALELSGVKKGDKILFTYPPLVNLFHKDTLEENNSEWDFLYCSSRDALILALCEMRPAVVIGESTFLKATLQDAVKTDFIGLMPKGIIFITAGTPLDLEFPEVAKNLVDGYVHDLYGCQEFGWLTLDGFILRDDISLIEKKGSDYRDLIVGGLPTGDSFPLSDSGKVLTHSRVRTNPEYEVTVLKTTAQSAETIERLAKTILRIKAKIVRVSPNLETNFDKNVLALNSYNNNENIIIEETEYFETLLEAQKNYQSQNKTDPAWIKRR